MNTSIERMKRLVITLSIFLITFVTTASFCGQVTSVSEQESNNVISKLENRVVLLEKELAVLNAKASSLRSSNNDAINIISAFGGGLVVVLITLAIFNIRVSSVAARKEAHEEISKTLSKLDSELLEVEGMKKEIEEVRDEILMELETIKMASSVREDRGSGQSKK